jgi:hypothetical protein
VGSRRRLITGGRALAGSGTSVPLFLALSCSVAAQTHINQPIPKYVTGDECLFCHRVKVADTWGNNPHARTIHTREDSDAELVLGSHFPQRSLKPDSYGKFDLLATDGKTWDKQAFALRCAGCHTTAVDPQTHAFSASSLDCYTCHGIAPENHPNDTSLIWFSKKHAKDPKQIASICGQCHLREGKAKSNGLPYPNNFVAGDDLFADFQVDFARAGDPNLNPGDRHILRNVRDVLLNASDTTCISCHNIHNDTSAKHRIVLSGPICLDCHNAEGPKKIVKKYEVHSDICEY